MGKDLIHLPLLQFADDTLFFCKFDDQMLLKLKEAIRPFEWCSGQKVNWEKSTLSGVNIPEDILLQTANRIGYKAENLPIIYVGLPLGGYPQRQELWQLVIDRIHKKLDGSALTSLEEEGKFCAMQSWQASELIIYTSLKMWQSPWKKSQEISFGKVIPVASLIILSIGIWFLSP